MLSPITVTRLEKAATDNGFELDLGRTADWLLFGSSQTSMRIWLTAVEESLFVVALSRADVLDALEVPAVAFTNVPTGATGARGVPEIPCCTGCYAAPFNSRVRCQMRSFTSLRARPWVCRDPRKQNGLWFSE